MDFEVRKRHDGFDTIRFEDGTFGYRTARGEVRGGFKSPSGATLSAKRAIAKAGAEALRSPDPATAKADEELSRYADRIREVYGRAEAEMREKQGRAMERYEEGRVAWEARVSSGEATREEFDAWLRGQASMQGAMLDMTEQLARTMAEADAEAVRMVSDGHLAGAYAEGMNFSTYQVEHGAGVSTSFTLYDRATVDRLLREGMEPLPERGVDPAKDLAWNRRKVQGEVLQGILQGESADAVAKRLRGVLDMDRRAALRVARTELTGAQNAGRADAYARAKAMGIGLRQEWQATYDARTRHTHAALDGEQVELGEEFSNGLRYPGDPDGPPSEVYNCRCTLVPILGGLDDGGTWKEDLKVGEETYEQWKARHAEAAGMAPAAPAAAEGPVRRVVEGRDILSTWERRPDQFDFAIEDVMDAQGFDGLPRVVSAEEFDRLYTGDQPLLLRTFSAPDAETLAGYDDMLLNGKWYVDCSDGGSQYGQGMYAAGVYGEKGAKKTQRLLDGAMREMEHYQTINGRSGMESIIKTMTLDPSAKVVTYKELTGSAEFRQAFKRFDAEQSYAANVSAHRSLTEAIGSADYLSDPEKKAMTAQLDKAMASLERSHAKGTRVATDKFVRVAENMRYRQLGYTGDLSSYGDKMDWGHAEFGGSWGLDEALKSDSLDANAAMAPYESLIDKNAYAGVYGASRGYDAINAVGHGASRSYTVVLNRTKLIVRED